jgi:protein-S-isoprenylcysteine O-methyltransferase Ste14
LKIGNRIWLSNFPVPEYHLAFLIVGLGLHFWPTTAITFGNGWPSIATGALCLLVAAMISLWSVVVFDRDATAQPTILRTGGPYKFSRNPMYLGWSLVLVGTGLIAGSWWLLIVVLPAVFVTQIRVIASEEKFLTERFGDEYAAYRRSVRRWF